MYKIDENVLADGRTLIAIVNSKDTISRLVKNGTIHYSIDTNDLYLSTPRSKDYSEYYRIIQENPSGVIPNNLTFGGTVTINGDLNVLGTHTIIDTPTMSIEDNTIELNRDEKGAGISLGSAGVNINRGTKPAANILFSESAGGFTLDTNNIPALYVYTEGASAGNVKIVKDLTVQGMSAGGPISGNSTLSITGAATLGSTLGVTGATTLSSTLGVSGATTISNTLTATGAASFSSSATVTGALWGKSTLQIDGTTTLNNTLTVKDTVATTLGGAATIKGNTQMNGTLTVGTTSVQAATQLYGTLTVGSTTANGATVLHGTVAVDKAATLSDNLSVGGNLTVTGTTTNTGGTTFNGAVSINNTLGVTGAATLGSSLGVTGALTVTGTSTFNGTTSYNNTLTVGAYATSLGGTLTVTGATSINNTLSAKATTVTTLHATGAATLDSTLTVTGNASVGGTFGVTGATTLAGLTAGGTTLSSLSVTNNASVGGTLGVTGASTLSSTLSVAGASTMAAATLSGILTANSTSTFNDAVTITKNGLTATGYSEFKDDLEILGNLTVHQDTTIDAGLTVVGSTSLQQLSAKYTQILGQFYVQNEVTLNSSITGYGAASFGSTLSVTGASTLTGAVSAGNTLTVAGATTINNTLKVTGASTFADLSAANGSFSGTLGATGATTLGSSLTVSGATTLNNNLTVSGTLYGKSTLTIDGAATLNSTLAVTGAVTGSSTIKAGTGLLVGSGSGNGLKFWDSSDNYKIWMSVATDATYGGRIVNETTSDYNMYFKMAGGTNRGFVFDTGATGTPQFAINPDAVRSVSDIYVGTYKVYHQGNLSLSGLTSSGVDTINTTGAGNIVNFQVSGTTKASVDTNGRYTGTIDWTNINNKPAFTPDSITSTGVTYANTTGAGNIIEFRVNGAVKSAIDKNGNFTGSVTTTAVAAQTAYPQGTPTLTMAITHNMNKMPNVIITDATGTVVYGDIKYNDANNLTITFVENYTGTVYLS